MQILPSTSFTYQTEDHEENKMEQIAEWVAAAETKEDLFAVLAHAARQFGHEDRIVHDESFMNGAAEGLLSSLNKALLLRDSSRQKYYRTGLSFNKALQCTVLVSAIEMMLRCSHDTLAEQAQLFDKDLVTCLPQLINLFVAWEGGDALRLLTISNSIKIIRRVGPVCQQATNAFVDVLLLVLRSYVGSTNIHVEAANAIALLFDRQEKKYGRKQVIELIQNDSSLIISTLSTGALAASPKDAEEILTGIFNFSVNSHIFRSKSAKRRCTILAISKYMTSEHVECRKLALNISKCLLNDHIHTSCEPRRLDQNTQLLVDKVIQVAGGELDTMLQLYSINMLGDAVQNANLSPEISNSIIVSLEGLVNSDGKDDVVMEAAITYTKAAMAMPKDATTKAILKNLSDFTTLPFARARACALFALGYFSKDDELAAVLLGETDMIENFTLIISYGSNEDCAEAMKILRQLASNNSYHTYLCQNSSTLLRSLVQLVTTEEVISWHAYILATETCLDLLSEDENIRHFLPYPDLLPSLVELANSTSDEDLKEKLVSTIVRLSSAILG